MHTTAGKQVTSVVSTAATPVSVARAAVRPGSLAVAGSAVFAALLVGVVHHTGLAALDPQITRRVVSLRTPALSSTAQVVTILGSEPWLAAVTVVATVMLLLHAERFRAGVVAASMVVSATSTVVVKFLIDRPRPGSLVELGVPEARFSFPSGHTLNSTVCYGIIALMSLPLLRSAARRIVVGSSTGALVLAVGLSRLYLGYHWLTDVLAGWTLGLTILALAVTVTTIWMRSSWTQPWRIRVGSSGAMAKRDGGNESGRGPVVTSSHAPPLDGDGRQRDQNDDGDDR